MSIINNEYQQQIQAMHQGGKFNNGAKAFKLVKPFIEQYHPTELLDFGCGKGALIAAIQEQYPSIAVFGYDPGNPDFAAMPTRQFDTVISTDAIEHIEPEHLDQTLAVISDLMTRCGFFRIACYPAKKRLPDGRNCHLIVQEPAWWQDRIRKTMAVDIVWERTEVVDKREKWPELFGSNYDCILVKK
jgi:cyclopropane fatty-acyl-phospholipid synthase-like methyltransferase